MSIYINDEKEHRVREYSTMPKIEKAIETLLMEISGVICCETYEGYEVAIKEIENGNDK